MPKDPRLTRHPRCFLLYAIAPDGLPAAEANRLFNEFVGNTDLPLALFHDHFIGRPGGIAIFFVATPEERDTLLSQSLLDGWTVDVRPLIFSSSPSAFDEQIAFTLRAYRGVDWAKLQTEDRPRYGSPSSEAETGEEDNNPPD